jgi:hypothetical protein
MAVLQRDLNHEGERLKAEAQAQAAAEAAKAAAVEPSPSPDVEMVPIAVPARETTPSIQSTPLTSPSINPASARRQSTISFSSLNRPQFAQKLDLSAAALHFSPDEIAGRPASPVTLAPKSARLLVANEFPPDFMAVLAEQASTSNRPVDIDLTLDDVPSMGNVALGSSADQPIELDLDIDMAGDMSAMPTMDLFGEGAPSIAGGAQPKTEDINMQLLDAFSTAPTQEHSTEALLASLASSSTAQPPPDAASGGEAPQFDMAAIDFSNFNSMGPSMNFGGAEGGDMNILNIDALLGMSTVSAEGDHAGSTSGTNDHGAAVGSTSS